MAKYTPQTSVTDRDTRVQGRISAFKPVNTDSRTADGATAIDPGMAVIKSTADYDVILPAAIFTYAQFQGVVAWSPTDKEISLDAGDKSYEANDDVTIIKDGEVEILLGGTVAMDDDLFFVHTAAGASAIHTYRADLDTNKASQVPMIALEAGVSGDVIKAHVSLGGRISKMLT